MTPTDGATSVRSLCRVLCCAASATAGIDLGTTNSAVAVIVDGKPVIVPNSIGNPTTPSVVAFTSAESVLVGERALAQASSNVENTFHSVKRFMGRSIQQVAQDAATVGFNVGTDEENEIAFLCPARPEPVAPEEVSATVLAQLVGEAEERLGVRIASVVITVPAYYNERQRLATQASLFLSLGMKIVS